MAGMIQVASTESSGIVRSRVCSRCHGQLTACFDSQSREHHILTCSTPGCPCDATVSRKGVERQSAEQAAAKQSAIRATRSIVPWVNKMFPQKTEAQIMHELGY